MRDVNKVLLIGRLGGDPVLKATTSGVAFTRFSVATSSKRRPRSGGASEAPHEGLEQEVPDEVGSESLEAARESTVWHRVVAWGREGEICARYLKKGAPVFVEGRIRHHRYTNREGQAKTDWEVHADRVSFLPGGAATSWAPEAEGLSSGMTLN